MTPELSERIRVNPFGIALARPLDPTKEEPGQLVLSGNFSHLPNVDGALWLVKEIMPILRRRYPGVKLSIVGNAPPPSVKALACEDIVVTGRVSEIEPYLERASVILAPLRIGGGQRMKVLQGMALGKAVVTTPRGAQGLSIAQIAPPLAIASNAEAFAEATSHLLKNTAARRKLGQQARAFVEQHYSQAAYAERLEAVYAELCSTGVKV
jgi:glycosyltransferase involved in cell wall biosynthesis